MVAALLPLSPLNAQRAKDIPLRITLHETAVLMNLDGTAVAAADPVPSAIVGDGNDVYTDGHISGVTIKFSSGTHDAVLGAGKRSLTVKLPTPIPGSATPQTPPPGSYTAELLNINNVICYGCVSPGQPYVTRAILGGIQFNGDTHNLRFMPVGNLSTLPFASGTFNGPGYVNSPNITSLVVVLPQPYNCSQHIYPSWIVRGTLPNTPGSSLVQVGTLVNVSKGVPAGQFSMPFELRVEALECFNPGY
jgi:hypothetical protein